ncbi:MAG: dihydrolipoyl dehydrogenase family protein [Rhodospirillales bacterium]
MTETLNPDICVIGGGSGGLSVAAGASQMGAKVVLVEKHKMGGDCLNYGCVPSKALLAAAGRARTATGAAVFGISHPAAPRIDGKAVFDHVKGVIEAIAPMDSVERFEGLGVQVIQGAARFTDARTIEVDGRRIRPKYAVIATGSHAFVPPIEGLELTPFFSNETIFDQKAIPEHLIVLGAGPIGIEMAQAHARLGARVTVLEMARALPKDDPELAAVVLAQIAADGVTLREGVQVIRVAGEAGAIDVTLATADGITETIRGTALLVATGRRANVDGLGLEAAGIEFSARGISVDTRLRTSNKRVFAIGDVAGGLQFTHVAGYHAGIVIRNALFRLPAKADHSAVPWVTYTDPEVAQVGLTEAAARAKGLSYQVLRWPFFENDRAQAERATAGLIKAIVTPKGKILGAGIAGKGAGDLIQPWVLALSQGLKIAALASMVAPYPTRSEISKRAAGSFYTPKLFSDRTRSIVRFLLRLP